MALPILPSPSNFLGVALVINRSRDGPSFVFHYPPHVNVAPVPAASDGLDDDQREHGNGRHAKDYDYDEGGDFADREQRLAPGLDADGSSPAALLRRNQDDHLISENGTQIVPWEHVAGFPTKDLESILTPGRAYHKTLFQLSLDPIYCVSYPIHVPESGSWKKRKKKKKNKQNEPRKKDNVFSSSNLFSATIRDHPDAQYDSDAVRQLSESVRLAAAAGTQQGLAGDGPRRQDVEDGHELEPQQDADDDDDERNDEEKEKDKNDKVSSMTMLNLVFFLNPKKHEVKELVSTMYTHIIRQVNKCYKYCQERNDFVWKESKKILALKDKAREDKTKMTALWHEILAASSLAQSMQDVYETISQNRIAVLQLDTADGAVTHSVQIPMPLHISDLPQEGERDAPGIWLTTANSFAGQDPGELGFLDRNFGLLLLDEDKKIITELQSDPDESTMAMIEFIRHSKPTLSFHQVASQSNLLNLSQIHQFAHHFIFWRRAIAIPPLHARDVYVLSPNCDLEKLPQASVKFARAFPHCPPLPNILADLSAAPRPYKFFCPNKTIRAEYMRILTWLMRGGWVTQLCTFAYVVVWPEIIYEVEHALEAEELARAKAAQAAASAGSAFAADAAGAPPSSASAGSVALTPTSVSDERKGSGASQLQLLSPQPRSGSVSTATDGPDGVSDDGDAVLRSTTASPSDHSRPASSSPSVRSPTGSQPAQHARPQPTAAQQAAEKARLGRLADKAARELAEKASAHARRPQPARTAHPSVNNAPHLAHLSPHIILDPNTATGTESLYLSAIGRRLRERSALLASAGSGSGSDPASAPGGLAPPPSSVGAASLGHHGVAGIGTSKSGSGGGGAGGEGVTSTPEWDGRVANTWPVFWKYFNGHCALERIALQEDMKRRDAWALLTAMSEYLLCIRHW